MNPLRRIGVIGDVHCEVQSLNLAIETLRRQNITTIVCTGDIPTGPGDINLCCDLLRKNKIITVRGNHDRWLLDRNEVSLPFATMPGTVAKSSWHFLESLPATIELPTLAGQAQLCHGLGEHDMLSVLHDQSESDLNDHPVLHELFSANQYRIVINGHSHRPMVRRFSKLTIINAGTLRRDHDPCFAEVDFESGLVAFWKIVNGQVAQTADCFEI